MFGARSQLDRYEIFEEIAAGGMATVHLGRLRGHVGFSRTVAMKRLHPHLAKEPEFASMFVDEARLAARVRHPNVVPTLDVINDAGGLVVVMDYVHGETLSRLFRASSEAGTGVPLRIAIAVLAGALHGLHAAHEATNEQGAPLGLVHRDVSPQNILVGADGVPRVLDFGIAKAAGRLSSTREGQVKGKFQYMSPEQITNGPVDRKTDIFAASVILWELLTGRRLFEGDDTGAVIHAVLTGTIRRPTEIAPDIPQALDDLVLRGLAREREMRFATAREMALALERLCAPATASEIGVWVEATAARDLAEKARRVAQMEAAAPRAEIGPEAPVLAEPAPGPRTAVVPAAEIVAAALAAGRPGDSTSAFSNAPSEVTAAGEKRRGLLPWSAAIGGFLGVAIVSLAFVRPWASHRGDHAAPPSKADPSSAPASVEPPPVPSPAPTASDPPPRPVQSITAPRPRPRAAPAPRASRDTPPAATSAPVVDHECDTPYVIDATGLKVPKKQCFTGAR